MEQKLRLIGKYCWYAIAVLTIFLVYRLPHRNDYLYDERTVFAKIQVVDSTLEILEVDLSQYAFGTNEYYIFKKPLPSYKIDISDGSTHFDRGDRQSYDRQAMYKLAYYSFSEDVIFDAKLSDTIINEIDKAIRKTKAKSRYFRLYYEIDNGGKINLNVMEEYHGVNSNKKDVFIYSCSYQAKKVLITPTLRADLNEYFYISTADWNKVKQLKYNWMVKVSTPAKRVLAEIESNSLVYDSWQKTDLVYDTETNINSFPKTLPREITIETKATSGSYEGGSITQIINFEPDSVISTFNEIYEGEENNDLSLILIKVNEYGYVKEPIMLERGNKIRALIHKEIKKHRW